MYGIVERRNLPRPNAVSHNIREKENKSVNPPCDLDPLQNLIRVSFCTMLHPATKFNANWFCRFNVMLQTNKPTSKQTDKKKP